MTNKSEYFLRATGTQEWWVCDKNITSEVQSWMKQHNITYPWDESTQALFVMRFA